MNLKGINLAVALKQLAALQGGGTPMTPCPPVENTPVLTGEPSVPAMRARILKRKSVIQTSLESDLLREQRLKALTDICRLRPGKRLNTNLKQLVSDMSVEAFALFIRLIRQQQATKLPLDLPSTDVNRVAANLVIHKDHANFQAALEYVKSRKLSLRSAEGRRLFWKIIREGKPQ